jgi:hypothetical protein
MATQKQFDLDRFMATARERYAYALANDAEDRKDAESDVDFVHGNQWNERARRKREKYKRPIQTWNRLPTFVAQIVNDGRESKPAIQVTPMDGGNPATARMLQSRIRHIEYETDADIAYDTAREQQVVSGRGFIRIGTEYQPASFDQRITIEPIENQFSVLFDPAAKKYSRRDARWAFVVTALSKEAYEERFGETAAARSSFFAGGSNPVPEWIGVGPNAEQVQVAEYWVRECYKRTLCLLDTLHAVYKDELTAEQADRVMDEREDDCYRVIQYIIDGVEILDETEFLIPYIPIVPVWGRQMMVDGRRRNYSLVRYAKDPQRLVNLYVSNIAEQIAMMPKTPYKVQEGQLEGREKEWAEINEIPRGFIQYKAKSINGEPAPPPERDVNEPPIQALTIGLNQAIDGIKAAMGIFDASLGAGPGDTAGIAIERRQKESDVANFHFQDNEARSRKYAAEIILGLLRVLDKRKGVLPTRMEDGKTHLIEIGKHTRDPRTNELVFHDLSSGEYGVAVATGPTYTSARQQANETYSQIAAHDPNFMQVAGDLYFRTSDLPGADLIADRYEKMLPQPLKPQSQLGEQQLQQTVQQLAQQHQQLVQVVHQQAQIIEGKQVEAASRERIEALKAAKDIRVALIGAKNREAIADADREAARLEGMFDRAHDAAVAEHAVQSQQQQQQQMPEAA